MGKALMDRRRFLRFAGVVGAVEAFFGELQPAAALNWRKLTGSTETALRVRLPQHGIKRPMPTIATKGPHMLALRSDGLVFATGKNLSGQLGDNTIINK
jgi:hypothetical protein